MADRPNRYATLALTALGELEIPYRIITGTEAIAQRLWIRLNFFRAEWFLNRLEGVPYYSAILGQKPIKNVVEPIFRQVILDTPGISDIVSLTFLPSDKAKRQYALDFAAKAETGDIISSRDYPTAFIVRDPSNG